MAGDLIDQMIAQPGDYNQLCTDAGNASMRVKLPLYRFISLRSIRLSSQNLETLCRQRKEVAPVLVQRVASLDLSRPLPAVPALKFKKPKKGEEDKIWEGDVLEHSGLSPYQLSGVLYTMIIGLDTVEALPELLRLEEQLCVLIATAETNRKAEPPEALPDGIIPEFYGAKVPSERVQKIYQNRVTQRELLSVMMQLLRRQQFAPMLASSFEKKYETALKARAAEEDLRDIKTPEDAKAQGQPELAFDPIYHVPIGYFRDDPTVPYSTAVRKEIRGLVTQFLETVPRDQWKVTREPLPTGL